MQPNPIFVDPGVGREKAGKIEREKTRERREERERERRGHDDELTGISSLTSDYCQIVKSDTSRFVFHFPAVLLIPEYNRKGW